MKYVPYMVLGDDIEVVHSIPYAGDKADKDGNAGDIYFYFEQPDEVYGLKTATIDSDKVLIIDRSGFSDEEIRRLLDFSKNNASIARKMAEVGGVMNCA